MSATDPRSALDALVRERGESYAGLSRWLGRNDAYLQQFIKRGTPRRLPEDERRKLSSYLGVDETVLGGPASTSSGVGNFLPVRRLRVAAAAGSGRVVLDEETETVMTVDRGWLGATAPGARTVDEIEVRGDSMAPLLLDGDRILVDRGDGAARLRDGIYVLRHDDGLIVKRVARLPWRRAIVSSDNPAYPAWPPCDARVLDVVGRVVWVGRRLG